MNTAIIDPADTDRALTLSPAEYADELASFWRAASHTERVRWWGDASDDERDSLREALGTKATWAAVDAVIAAGVSWAGQKHLSVA